MIYRNRFYIRTPKKFVMKFDKFYQKPKCRKCGEVLDYNECVEYYNFCNRSGCLQNGYGLKVLTLPSGKNEVTMQPDTTVIKNIWPITWLNTANNNVQDYLFYVADDNKVHYYSFDYPTLDLKGNTIYTSVPNMTKISQNNADCVLISSPSDSLVMINQNGEYTYQNAPKILDACSHYGKTFAITADARNKLIYSSNNNLSNWTTSNVDSLDIGGQMGRLLKLMSFNDSLYIFREFGITRVSAYGMNSDFSVSHLYQSTSCIYPDTISICGEKVIFLTREGLMSFNGNVVKKLDYEIVDKIEKESISQPTASSFNGKYFLACKIDFSSGTIGCERETFINNAVIIFNFDEDNLDIVRGIDVKKFAPLNSVNCNKMCAIFNGSYKDKIGEFVDGLSFFGEGYKKSWKSAFSDYGHPDKLKLVTDFTLQTAGNTYVSIVSDIESASFFFTGKNKTQTVHTNIKGKRFSVEFFTSETTYQNIHNAKLSMTVYDS